MSNRLALTGQGALMGPVFSLPLSGMVVPELRANPGPVESDSLESPIMGESCIQQGKHAGYSKKQIPDESEYSGQSFLMCPEREWRF